MASRTDRGVSARGNALALSSRLPEPALLRALNGIAPDIFFTHAREVPESFRPRRARGRWYRYFETAEGRRPEAWRESARHLVGRIDVRSFGRALPREAPVWRDVEAVEVRSVPGWLEVDLRAPSFVWGMVRKLIAGLRLVDAGDLAAEEFAAAARGERRLTLPLAEPEGLVLWEVLYPEPWGPAAFEPTRAQREAWRRGLLEARLRERVLGRLWEGIEPPPRQA